MFDGKFDQDDMFYLSLLYAQKNQNKTKNIEKQKKTQKQQREKLIENLNNYLIFLEKTSSEESYLLFIGAIEFLRLFDYITKEEYLDYKLKAKNYLR